MATPASQPIGNVIASAPTREIKLPPFEEDMPQAWYNQAEAYFHLHGDTDRMFWFYYLQRALMPVLGTKEAGQGYPIHPRPTT